MFNAALSLNTANTLVFYTPNAGFSGPDSFSYQATDGFLNSTTVQVSVNVLTATIAN